MRYLKIIFYYARMCIIREMLYRANFIVRFFTDIVYLFGTIVLLRVIVSDDIAGWHSESLYIFLGTNYIINYLFTSFFLVNGLMLGNNVNRGLLDQILLMPVPSMFAVSFKIVDLSGLIQILIGVAMVCYGCCISTCYITVASVLIYLIQIICGVLILYGMFFSLMYTAFWFRKTQGLEKIFYSTYNFRGFPAEIFPIKARIIFTIIIPLTLVSNPAARTIILGPSLKGITVSIVTSIIWVGISRYILSRGLVKYRGAGA